MYKVGKDTAAVMLLLMHGASRLSLDGYGSFVLPDWCSDSMRADLRAELQTLGREANAWCPLSLIALARIRDRLATPFLGGRSVEWASEAYTVHNTLEGRQIVVVRRAIPPNCRLARRRRW